MQTARSLLLPRSLTLGTLGTTRAVTAASTPALRLRHEGAAPRPRPTHKSPRSLLSRSEEDTGDDAARTAMHADGGLRRRRGILTNRIVAPLPLDPFAEGWHCDGDLPGAPPWRRLGPPQASKVETPFARATGVLPLQVAHPVCAASGALPAPEPVGIPEPAAEARNRAQQGSRRRDRDAPEEGRAAVGRRCRAPADCASAAMALSLLCVERRDTLPRRQNAA